MHLDEVRFNRLLFVFKTVDRSEILNDFGKYVNCLKYFTNLKKKKKLNVLSICSQLLLVSVRFIFILILVRKFEENVTQET